MLPDAKTEKGGATIGVGIGIGIGIEKNDCGSVVIKFVYDEQAVAIREKVLLRELQPILDSAGQVINIAAT